MNATWASFDVLILVHPSFNSERVTPAYRTRVLEAIETMRSADRPVLWLPSRPADCPFEEELAAKGLLDVPNYLRNFVHVKRRCVRRRLQREVDFIADQVGRPPGRIRAAFGGMYREACVFFVATGWCRRVEPWWPEEVDGPFRAALPRRPIAEAVILPELSISVDA